MEFQRTVKSRCPWRDDVADKLGQEKASLHRGPQYVHRGARDGAVGAQDANKNAKRLRVAVLSANVSWLPVIFQ